MPEGKLKLLLVTTTRADWGILSPLARALTFHPGVELTIAAGNMHLSHRYDHTVDEIYGEGFSNVELLDSIEVDGTASSRTAVTAATATSVARILDRLHPDGVIVLGDRYELLGVAAAALIADVPIIHLHGGEVTEGAADDAVRNAVSKIASFHLVATASAGKRLRDMGEEPRRIVRTGALGVANTIAVDVMSREELSESLDGFELNPDDTLLVTFHPVTRHPQGLASARQVENLLEALEAVKECKVLITYPNNDPGSESILERLEWFAARNAGRVRLVGSLGRRRYQSAMHHVKAVVGNTSSGLLEAPSTPAYTLDIGPRQQGRERAKSVYHVDDSATEIEAAIRSILALPARQFDLCDNPYYRPDALTVAIDAITRKFPSLPKHKTSQRD